MLKKQLPLLIALIAVLGLSLSSAVLISRLFSESQNDHQLSAYVKWGSAPMPTEEWIEEKSKYDFLAFTFGVWDLSRFDGVKEELMKRNADIRMGTYFGLHSAGRWMRVAPEDSWGGRYWNTVKPYLARTTVGDTAAIFKDAYVWDLTNPVARSAVVDLLRAYVDSTGIDWAMLDFASVPLPNLKQFQDPMWEEMEEGDLDFDQDGVGHWDDPDEQQLLRESYYAFMREMKSALPNEFLLIPNGALAIYDPEFSALVDGCYSETFPSYFYGNVSDQFTNALYPTYPTSLWNLTNQSRWYGNEGFVLIEDHWDREFYGHIASLFDNCVELKIMLDETNDVSPVLDLELGAPLGDIYELNGEYRRDFNGGTLKVKPLAPNYVTYSIER